MDHFFGSTLFDNATIVRASSVGLADPSENIQSFIGAVNINPLADLALGGGFSSEPGAGRRNETAGLWGSYTWGPLTAEAEFYIALSRENYVRLTRPPTRPRERPPRRRCVSDRASRRSSSRSGSTTVRSRPWSWVCATRTSGTTAWRVRPECGPCGTGSASGPAGSCLEKGDIGVAVSGEYRYSDLERGGAARDKAVSDQHELFGKVSVTYK